MARKREKWIAPSARIANLLRERAASRKPGDELGTEVAIAKECGVSRMTARKAVNELVEAGLAERRAGVGVFVGGRSVGPRRWRFIAGNLMWDPAIKAASAARRAAQKIGVDMELRDAGGDMKTMLAEIAALPDTGVAGAIIFSLHDAKFDRAVRRIATKGFPIVVIDGNLGPKVNVSCVLSDNAFGGSLAADRIIRAGHKRLAFVGDFVADTVRARWEGFARIASGLTGATPLKYDIKGEDRLGDWETEVRAAVGKMLGRKVRPTVLFCSCDAIARHAMRALADAGVRVPADVSLVGFDDDPIAEWTSPSFTTVRQDFSTMGCEAVKALVQRAAKPFAQGAVLNVPVEFVSRESLVRHSRRA